MRTVVYFVKSNDNKKWKNRIHTKSMRRIGFIDNRHPTTPPYPRANEHWLVEILRENQNDSGGCFILKPIECVEGKQVPLVHGMYDLDVKDDAVILTPREEPEASSTDKKFWVISPKAKRAILSACEARAIVIKYDGDMWPKRRPAESVLESEARRLLGD